MSVKKNTHDTKQDETFLISSILDDLAKLPSKKTSPVTEIIPTSKPLIACSLAELTEYEHLFKAHEQDPSEHTIVGIDGVEAYVVWTQKALSALQHATDATRDDILAHVPRRIQDKEMEHRKPSEAHINLDAISDRLNRIEEKIHTLDETRPEYVEERASLERKKVFIKAEEEKNTSHATTSENQPASSLKILGKEQQYKMVEELLHKESFTHSAPVISPLKEEALRLKKAEEAQKLDSPSQTKPVATKTIDETILKNVTLTPLEKAFLLRESFITKLKTTPRAIWYESPSQNRDYVNEQVFTVAQILSGKEMKNITMNDIQTARIFLFDEATEDILKHPAFSYIESFYNYQNKQGYVGGDVPKATPKDKTSTHIESPFMQNTPPTNAENSIKSPFVASLSHTKKIVPSPFINLNNTKKKNDDTGTEFSI